MMADPMLDSESGQISLGAGAARLAPPPARFATVFSRPETRNARFHGQRVALDGHVFVNCEFEHCVLDASSANYDLIGCTLDPSTTITFNASVDELLRFANPAFPWPNRNVTAFFVPLRRNDGAVTVWFAGRFV